MGAVVGILCFSKFLRWLLSRWHQETLVALAGFIIGSLVKVWPWSNSEAIVRAQFPLGPDDPVTAEMIAQIDYQIPSAAICAAIGFALVFSVEYASKKLSKQSA